jgi:hypothetical protein
MGTKNNPGAFDCYAKAEPDEPMFVLLGRDPCAGPLITLWIAFRSELLGEAEGAKHEEARACSHALSRWAAEHGKSVEVAEVFAVFAQLISRAGREATEGAMLDLESEPRGES